MVGEATAGPRNTVVAGSFGKSTCTALMAHILRACGPRRRLDGRARSRPRCPTPATGATAPQVVLEGDEYIVGPTDRRSKFVLYHPRDVLLTSLVHDHVNVFPTFADYEAPFRELLRPAAGRRPAGRPRAPGDPRHRRRGRHAAIVWYDTGRCDGWWADDVVYGETDAASPWCGPDGGRIAARPPVCWASTTSRTSSASAPTCWSAAWSARPPLQAAVASFAGIRRRLDRLTTPLRRAGDRGLRLLLREGPLGHRGAAAALSAPAADGGVRAAHLLLAQPRRAALVRHGVRGRRPGADRSRRRPTARTATTSRASTRSWRAPPRPACPSRASRTAEAATARAQRASRATRWSCCSRPARC